MPTLYDNFERVRQYIDQHQGGGGDMSAYVTKDELSAQSYLTSIPNTYASYNGVYSYLHSIGIDKKGNGGSFIDSSYITDSELSGDIWINGVSTWELPTYAAISAMGYLTSIPSEYVTDSELSSTLGDYYTQGEVDNEIISALSFYYTKTEINNASYVTSSDLPVIDENLIPKEDNTYTLGDAIHLYANAYMYRLSSPQGGLNIRNGSTNVLTIGGGDIRPYADLRMSLGRSSNRFSSTYTTNIYTDTAYLQDTSYTKSIVPAENAAYTLGDNSHFYNATYSTNLWLANNNRFSGSQYTIGVRVNNQETVAFGTTALRPASNNGCTLGTSSNKWSSTYTSNLYADTIHNFIWTGTSAEYAALSDYTTYQIYLIQEA